MLIACTKTIGMRILFPYLISSPEKLVANFFGLFLQLRLPADTKYAKLPMWDLVEFPAPSGPPSSVSETKLVKISSLDWVSSAIIWLIIF